MKQISISMILFVSLLAASCSKGSDDLTPEERKVALQVLNQSFKNVVPAMMKKVSEVATEKEPAEAVAFCNENVANMGKSMQEKLGREFAGSHHLSSYQFGRTSNKIRNPANAPDEEQNKVLRQWQAMEKKGKKAKPVVYKSGDAIYAMRPIRIASPLCLKCHGTEKTLDEKAAAVIKERYPADKALGYAKDDLRGAFWVKLTM